MNARHSALALLVAVLWGVNFVAIDLGLHPDGEVMPPLLFVAMRFTLVVLPCIFFIRRPDVSWRAIIGVGLLMSAGQFGLLYLAMALGMPAGLASLVLQAQVLLTVLLAAGFLGERPSGRQLAGVVLGVAGLAVVAVGRSLVAPVLPLMIVLAAALSWAAGNIVARQAKAASGLGLVVWSGAVVPLPLLGLSLIVDGPAAVSGAVMELQPVTLLSALYTAVFGSLVGYGIWNRLLGLYPSSAVVPFTLLVPVVGMTTAWLILHEVPAPAEVAGGLLLLGGVSTAVLRPRTPRPATQRRGVQRRAEVLADGRVGALGGSLAGDFAADAPPEAAAGRLAAGRPAAPRGVGRDAEVRDAAVLDAVPLAAPREAEAGRRREA
ncbi:EamA family transporter [Pseudarthrobacter sp. S9]|uniref:EamA family transporter n=1 Tax=Pseudarthrobacter sp. S9 TaxID=3418421 RepID=UPI003CFC19B5